MAAVIVTDANILINMVHIGRLPLLAALDVYDFRVTAQVIEEITDLEQRAAVDAALTQGYLKQALVESEQALELYGRLRDIMGRGEASCLALAATAGFHIASDEKKRFRKRALELIGEGRLVRTETLLITAIRSGHLSVAEADACKKVLEARRYSMPFESFGELLQEQAAQEKCPT